jgi:hypothetical protein
VDYAYNIRGWLKQINDVANPDGSDLLMKDSLSKKKTFQVEGFFNLRAGFFNLQHQTILNLL